MDGAELEYLAKNCIKLKVHVMVLAKSTEAKGREPVWGFY